MFQLSFKIHKQVTFGQGVFLIGNIPEFGSWAVESSFRLTWNKGHIWTGNVSVSRKRLHEFKRIEYKYIVASWQNPNNSLVEWQIGQENRIIDMNFIDNQQKICDDWNMRRVKIHLITKKNLKDERTPTYRYSIVGNCSELGNFYFYEGNWKIRKGLRLQQNIDSKIIRKLSQKISKKDIIGFLKNQLVFQVHYSNLTIPRDQEKMSYYFIRENEGIQIERHPGRCFMIKDGEKYPHRYAIVDEAGHTGIYDEQNFDKPTFSKITSMIFLGSYLKTEKDVNYLADLGIKAIYSIQTSEDHEDNGISPMYLELLCKEYGLIFKTIEIQDKNQRDFVKKSKKAVQEIDELIRSGKTTYVYCSAGKYRSPQTVALYLVLKNGKDVQEAIRFIQEKHPVAKPNEKMIKKAIYYIRKFDFAASIETKQSRAKPTEPSLINNIF